LQGKGFVTRPVSSKKNFYAAMLDSVRKKIEQGRGE